MKFPLPRETFPVMKFPADQVESFVATRTRLLEAALDTRQEFYDRYKQKFDPRVWKCIKRHRGPPASGTSMSVYQARRLRAIPMPISSKTCSPLMVGVGSIEGHLDEVMLGLTSSNTRTMRFVSSYLYKDMLDMHVLSTLVTPTEQDPFDYLGLKWMVKGASASIKSMVRPRDFVFLESTGVTVDSNGQRVGHLQMHSVDFAGLSPLSAQFGVVRGAMSFCFLFSDNRSTGNVDVFVKGFIDPRGGISSHIATTATADAIIGCRKAAHCANKKKIAWTLRHINSSGQHQRRRHSSPEDARCAECLALVDNSSASSANSCAICTSYICGRCQRSTTTTCVASTNLDASEAKLSVCQRCTHGVNHLDPFHVAADEAAHAMRSAFYRYPQHEADPAVVTTHERVKLEPINKRRASRV